MKIEEAHKEDDQAIRYDKYNNKTVIVSYIKRDDEVYLYNSRTGKLVTKKSIAKYGVSKYDDWIVYFDSPEHIPDSQDLQYLQMRYEKLKKNENRKREDSV